MQFHIKRGPIWLRTG